MRGALRRGLVVPGTARFFVGERLARRRGAAVPEDDDDDDEEEVTGTLDVESDDERRAYKNALRSVRVGKGMRRKESSLDGSDSDSELSSVSSFPS